MADCIQVVNGKLVRPSLRYQAPRRAVVVRSAIPRKQQKQEVVKRDVLRIRSPEFAVTAAAGVTVEQILAAAARATAIPVEIIVSDGRARRLVVLRQAIMFLARTYANASFPQIGRAMGRDHSTIHHGVAMVKAKPGRFWDLLLQIVNALPVDGLCISQDSVSPCAEDCCKVAA